MSYRIFSLAAVFALVVSLHAQVQPPPSQQCSGGNCRTFVPADRGTVFPSVPSKGKWETLDFKPGDASVSCGVVKYEIADSKPTLHLLCPAAEIYAPLRVHLALSWADIKDVPEALKGMLVDTASAVKFKSTPGDARAELALHRSQESLLHREWIHFTKVNVALVLPPQN